MTDKIPKKKNVSVKFSHAVFPLLNFLTLQDATDRLFQNVGNEIPLYAAQCLGTAKIPHDNLDHSTLRNVSEQRRSHTTIWTTLRCTMSQNSADPTWQFGNVGLDLATHGLDPCDLV